MLYTVIYPVLMYTYSNYFYKLGPLRPQDNIDSDTFYRIYSTGNKFRHLLKNVYDLKE